MIYPLRKLAETRLSYAMARDLRLGYGDSIKYIASIGADQWPRHQSVVAIKGCKMPIRWNRIDALIVHEVMCSGYRVHSSPSRILDLGANIGAAVAYFAHLWPRAAIACVEPQAENVSVLRHTIVLNNLCAQVFPAAVAVEDGTIEFFVDTADPSSSSLLGGPGWESRTVSALSVPTLMMKMGWDSIDLLKIDIEGYEAQLFSRKADWLANTREITGEAHHGYSTQALRKDLDHYGFTVEILSKNEPGGMRVFHAFKKEH